jgi:hypothetical protein
MEYRNDNRKSCSYNGIVLLKQATLAMKAKIRNDWKKSKAKSKKLRTSLCIIPGFPFAGDKMDVDEPGNEQDDTASMADEMTEEVYCIFTLA